MENGLFAVYHDNSAHGDDAYLKRDLGHGMLLDAVFDGVSTQRGSKASTLARDMLNSAKIENPGDIVRIFTDVHHTLARESNVEERPATTATATLRIGKQLFIVGVGDSSAYLFSRGMLVGPLVELDREDPRIPEYNPRSITHAIGEQTTAPFSCRIGYRTLNTGDLSILLTDGITDNFDEGELRRILSSATTPSDIAAAVQRSMENKIELKMLNPANHFKKDDRTMSVRYHP